METVSELAGVPISHYAEINFDGFKDIVDALGGVEVDVPMTIDDADAAAIWYEGLQTLNGDQALILCRSRHAYEQYGDGDSFRAANQRLVLSAIAKKLLAADVATMAGTVQALSQYVTTDLEISDIVGLAQAMQGLDPSTDIYSAMEPTTSQYINNIWYEINDVDEWKKMMARVDQGLPPTEEDIVDEGSNTVLATTGNGDAVGRCGRRASRKQQNAVLVLNGNGTPSAGSVAAERIEALGYEVTSDNADHFDYEQTLVVYDDEGGWPTLRPWPMRRRGRARAQRRHVRHRRRFCGDPRFRLVASAARQGGRVDGRDGRARQEMTELGKFPLLAGGSGEECARKRPGRLEGNLRWSGDLSEFGHFLPSRVRCALKRNRASGVMEMRQGRCPRRSGCFT